MRHHRKRSAQEFQEIEQHIRQRLERLRNGTPIEREIAAWLDTPITLLTPRKRGLEQHDEHRILIERCALLERENMQLRTALSRIEGIARKGGVK